MVLESVVKTIITIGKVFQMSNGLKVTSTLGIGDVYFK